MSGVPIPHPHTGQRGTPFPDLEWYASCCHAGELSCSFNVSIFLTKKIFPEVHQQLQHNYLNLTLKSLNCVLVLTAVNCSGNLPGGVGLTSPGLESSESSLNRLTLLEPGPTVNVLTAVTCCGGLTSDTARDTTTGELLEPILSSCLGGI